MLPLLEELWFYIVEESQEGNIPFCVFGEEEDPVGLDYREELLNRLEIQLSSLLWDFEMQLHVVEELLKGQSGSSVSIEFEPKGYQLVIVVLWRPDEANIQGPFLICIIAFLSCVTSKSFDGLVVHFNNVSNKLTRYELCYLSFFGSEVDAILSKGEELLIKT